MFAFIIDEGEIWPLIFFYLAPITLILFVGIIIPITAIVTYIIYHSRLHYKFTWAKDFIEQEKTKSESAQ